jgi:zinc transport system substrate-binding protein
MKKCFLTYAVLALLFSGCTDIKKNDKPLISAAIFPFYDFAKEVAGDKADIFLLLPPGAEAHSFEPRPGDIIKIGGSSLFIYTGSAMEPWAEDIIKGLGGRAPQTLSMEKHISFKTAEAHHDEHDNGEEIEDDEHSHGAADPHIWLDFELAQQAVMLIAETLAELDEANAAYYRNNAAEYNKRLQKLDDDYRETLKRCEIKTVIHAGHFAFSYLTSRYGLTHLSPYSGFSPDAEPGPAKIAEMIENIYTTKSTHIFYEEILEPRIARAIAKESGVKLELLHAAHNLTKEEISSGLDFIGIMEANLEKLKTALRYQ